MKIWVNESESLQTGAVGILTIGTRGNGSRVDHS